jgi:hypothetical protein
MIEDFIEAKNNNKVFFKKNLIPITPKWDDFITLLSNKYNTPINYGWNEDLKKILIKNKIQDFLTDIFIYDKFDPVILRVIEYNKDKYLHNSMPKAEPLVEYFKNIYDHFQLKAILNFIGNEGIYTAHKDNHDVISWHCVGTMEWRIYPTFSEDKHPIDYIEGNEPYDSYILEPGDVIYVPKNTGHRVISNTPRASLILQAQ